MSFGLGRYWRKLSPCIEGQGGIDISGVNCGSPWAGSPREGAGNLLECALGRCSSGSLSEWQLPAGFDAEGVLQGEWLLNLMSGLMAAWWRISFLVLLLLETVVFTYRCSNLWAKWRWGHLDDDVGGGCRCQSLPWCSFCSLVFADCSDGCVLGELSSLCRLMTVFTLVLTPWELCVTLVACWMATRPAELVKDGCPILLIERVLRLRGLDTVCITKVKGHADETMVRTCGVRELDRLDDGADEAADFGRRRVHWGVMDARRNFGGACSR